MDTEVAFRKSPKVCVEHVSFGLKYGEGSVAAIGSVSGFSSSKIGNVDFEEIGSFGTTKLLNFPGLVLP